MNLLILAALVFATEPGSLDSPGIAGINCAAELAKTQGQAAYIDQVLHETKRIRPGLARITDLRVDMDTHAHQMAVACINSLINGKSDGQDFRKTLDDHTGLLSVLIDVIALATIEVDRYLASLPDELSKEAIRSRIDAKMLSFLRRKILELRKPLPTKKEDLSDIKRDLGRALSYHLFKDLPHSGSQYSVDFVTEKQILILKANRMRPETSLILNPSGDELALALIEIERHQSELGIEKVLSSSGEDRDLVLDVLTSVVVRMIRISRTLTSTHEDFEEQMSSFFKQIQTYGSDRPLRQLLRDEELRTLNIQDRRERAYNFLVQYLSLRKKRVDFKGRNGIWERRRDLSPEEWILFERSFVDDLEIPTRNRIVMDAQKIKGEEERLRYIEEEYQRQMAMVEEDYFNQLAFEWMKYGVAQSPEQISNQKKRIGRSASQQAVKRLKKTDHDVVLTEDHILELKWRLEHQRDSSDQFAWPNAVTKGLPVKDPDPLPPEEDEAPPAPAPRKTEYKKPKSKQFSEEDAIQKLAWMIPESRSSEAALTEAQRLEIAKDFIDALSAQERKIFVQFLGLGGEPSGVVEQILNRWKEELEYY